MTQFVALSVDVEVNGEAVLSAVAGMGAMKITAIELLKKFGIVHPMPGEWYPQQAWLDAFKEIAEKIGSSTLYRIGLKIPEFARFPLEIDGVENALRAIDVAYHMNHRGGSIGDYKLTLVGPREAVLVCENPYPCDFDRGIIEAMARRCKPAGSFVSVKHDDGRPCRKAGADSCTYHVTW
jgi:hypothetical protein